MMKHLNNKGYMLVEIILASVLSMVVAYFVIDLTIKLKNKNDDLLVKTLVATDQAIIYNTIMRDLNSGGSISCGNIDNKIKIENNKFIYNNEFISEISNYADVSNVECSIKNDDIVIKIPISVKQLSDDFSVVINHEYVLEDSVTPVCSLSVDTTKNEIIASVIEDGSGIQYSGWNSDMITGNGIQNIIVDHTGSYTYYVRDMAGNDGSCSVNIIEKNVCPLYYTPCSSSSNCDCVRNVGDAILIKTYKGTCDCRDPDSSSPGYWPDARCDPVSGCDCPSGLVPKTSCKYDSSYECNSGTLSGTKCYSYKKFTDCIEGYSSLNDNYCYKIN